MHFQDYVTVSDAAKELGVKVATISKRLDRGQIKFKVILGRRVIHRGELKKIKQPSARSYTRHGMSKTRTYRAWAAMKQRCHSPSSASYKNYGGKGVVVCDQWRNDFRQFLVDMKEAPTEEHTIDRINNELGYGPGNCRWATSADQQKNRRRVGRLPK